jgi:sugar phosphate isomerase/epimerase
LIKEVSEKQIMKNLHVSEQLSINYTIFHSNIITLIKHKFYYENWINKHVEFWGETTSKFKTTVLLENMWDESPDLLLEVINQVGSDKLKICFDTGHCNIFSKVSMREWFRKTGSEIPYIHLNDNMGDYDSELPPGQGNINWKEFNNLVNEFCNHPTIVIEVGSPDNIKKSIDFLQENRIYPYN